MSVEKLPAAMSGGQFLAGLTSNPTNKANQKQL